jgi:hypothetical protein
MKLSLSDALLLFVVILAAALTANLIALKIAATQASAALNDAQASTPWLSLLTRK